MRKRLAGGLREVCLKFAMTALRDGNRAGMIRWAKRAGAVHKWGTRQ